jgi:thiosulfate/3-mercaptopyruvate sulfurtransferase
MTSPRTAPTHHAPGHQGPTDPGAARDAVLVQPEWLESHLHDPALRVVEIDVSPAAYRLGHVPGAVLWNIYQDLKDADYRLVDDAAIGMLFSRSGITPESTVVCYGYAPAMAFWLLKLYGHHDVRILDASRATWADAGRPWTTDVTVPTPSRYGMPLPDARIRADHRQVTAAIGDPTRILLDVRTDQEFTGERFWPSGGMEDGGRAGHVPTAINLTTEGILDEHGGFRGPDELRGLFSPAGLPDGAAVITYCTIGGRASTAWFALTYLLGRDDVRVYDGSWAEWGRMAATPVTN